VAKNTATIGSVNVKPGDQIKAGEVLGSLLLAPVTRVPGIQPCYRQENLAELTSPESIANAKLAITTAQTNVIMHKQP